MIISKGSFKKKKETSVVKRSDRQPIYRVLAFLCIQIDMTFFFFLSLLKRNFLMFGLLRDKRYIFFLF